MKVEVSPDTIVEPELGAVIVPTKGLRVGVTAAEIAETRKITVIAIVESMVMS